MLIEVMKTLENSVIEKLKQHRMQMLLDDIKCNSYRVLYIFTRLDDAQDKDDMLSNLKQLAAEELTDMDLPTIALIIKDCKVGQGLKFLARNYLIWNNNERFGWKICLT